VKQWALNNLAGTQFDETQIIIIDDRTLVLGLDELYRTAMKRFESHALLTSARAVVQHLGLELASGPIEGYYHETPELTEYFRSMRSLQHVDEKRESEVSGLPEFQLLWRLTNSPLYGRPQRKGKLLPVGRDPLSQALKDADTKWNVEHLVKLAYEAALKHDDFSLVGLAARTQDAVALTAVRESTVLYAEVMVLGMMREPEYKYEWRVEPALAEAANRFIETFNQFVPNGLPRAEAANADRYFKACTDNDAIGRCVRIGQLPDESSYYHWAIAVKQTASGKVELAVDEFWSEHVWTTQIYRKVQGRPGRMKFFQESGVPEDKYDLSK
jgi:hypothetical protein